MNTNSGIDRGVDKGVRILSLDSGGPGTYSQLLILREYMVRLANDLGLDEGDVYPADYFDLMGGVGFGGLVAIFLGHLRMNADEAVDAFRDVALAIFPDSSHPNHGPENTDTEGVRWSVREMAADCEAVAKELSTRLCDMDAYLRLNVDRGMENLLMNEWDDLGPIETHTSAYVERTEISETINASLRRLQESAGTVTLGEINHPRATKDVEDKLSKQREVSDRAFRVVKENEDSRILNRLKPVDAPSYFEGRSCMKDTRKHILDHIVNWAATLLENNIQSNNPVSTNIFWLYGSPGLGKTSVANSLSHRLHESRNLGGTFFCRRDDPVLCDPNRVLPTLLYRLAWMWNPYRDCVVQALLEDPNLNPDWTGCSSLLEHLYSLENHPKTPLVLVIDALDESGDPRTRAPLLKCVSEIWTRVHWLKIVVTSRPEHDIASFFQKLELVGCDLSMDAQARQDIRLFTRYCMDLLAEQYHLPSDWPGEARLEEIVRRSSGLFIFVETLYRFLDDPNPELLLTQVLSGALGEANVELHKLYSTAIETRIGRCREDFRLFVQALVAVATHRPLPDKTLASLVGLEPRVVSSWVERLSSLLYRDVSENGGIRVRHLSVIEFLTSPTCPPEFRVDPQEANGQLGHRCLITMMTELEFNICKLGTSSVFNADIQDLDNRVQEKISDTLQYSSMHWSSHLCSGSSPASKVYELLSAFLTGTHSLYWLEVLSLMGKVPVAISALRLLKANLKKFDDCHQRAVEDALRFVLAFFTPISTSTPHLYISGLSFMPAECSLWKCAKLSFPRLMNVCEGRMEYWPAPSGVWQGHTSHVRSVAYSPDGRNVISGSWDKTIRIWDAATGAAVGEPLKGHIGWIYSVAYSPNGQNVVSGSNDNTIRIWNAETGALAAQPLKGHTGSVMSVTYSPDSHDIVSGSDDKTIRIWKAETGEPFGESLKGHTGPVLSVAYSPDGREIVSGSGDRTIRIWNAKTGTVVRGPLKGHTGSVYSVTYSPDGLKVISGSADNTIITWDTETREAVWEIQMRQAQWVYSIAYSPNGRNIASASGDNIIRIWDAETGAALGEPLKGHHGPAYSVSYSPDGRSVVSGSLDNTIRIWDAQTRSAVGEPQKGHNTSVESIAYSPDGWSIASGFFDNTIRIWHAETGEAIGEPLKGHTGPVLSVAYSPDGRSIVSGSSDNTIRIWDGETGATVGEPLKGHTGWIRSVAFSPNGQNVISGSSDTVIRIWDVKTGAAVGEPLKGHTGWVRSVAYSSDGRNIISGSSDNTIRIWDAETGAAVGEPLKGHMGSVYSVAYSPDGRNIISGSSDNTIRVWDAETGSAVGKPLQGHTQTVCSVAYSPDGRSIVSGSYDRTIRIWDPETGVAVAEPQRGHAGSVYRVAYSPNGRKFTSGSQDHTIRIWETPTNIEDSSHGALSKFGNQSDDHPPPTVFSGLPIPTEMLDSNGWVHGREGLLFWVPEDCRNGLTCPAITTIPTSGRHRVVRIDFTRFQYGISWTNVCGGNA